VPAALVLALALLLGCTEPAAVETAPEGAEDPVEAEILDPTSDELRILLDEVLTTVERGRDALRTASEASSQAELRAAADEALALLLDDSETAADPAALLPARTAERGTTGEQDDLLTTTLSLARDAGGTLGRATVETLRDAVAGDVGAWERDAEGVVANTEAAVTGVNDLDTATTNVLALEGDATRALAWTLLALQAPDLELAREAAARGAGHLGVVVVTIELLIDPPPPAEQDPDVELEGEQVPDELDGRLDDADDGDDAEPQDAP
jgi:hypothetical protein